MFFRGKNKYNNKKTIVDDIVFDSKKEEEIEIAFREGFKVGVLYQKQKGVI